MINTENIIKKFEKIGTIAEFIDDGRVNRRGNTSLPIDIDVVYDPEVRKEVYKIRVSDKDIDLTVMDVNSTEKHLLMLCRFPSSRSHLNGHQNDKDIAKFLCGHDERHYFVSGVPENSGASTVDQAREALKPKRVQNVESRKKVKAKNKFKHNTGAYIRQGEWFFVPVEGFDVGKHDIIKKNEPISRGGGSTAHMVDEVISVGGVSVWVHPTEAQNGVSSKKMHDIINKTGITSGWQQRVSNARVYARGKVKHRDHKTVYLPFWHEVIMNTESDSRASKFVSFLD